MKNYKTQGTSLVVQWQRLCAPNAGAPGSIPDQRARSHTPQLTPDSQISKWSSIWSHPVTANRWELVETVSDFILLSSKITADGDCSPETKRRLLLGRKVMTNLDSILKSKDTTLPTKVHLVKAMVFPVVMYGCESWTMKKAEHQRIDDAFELSCWRRLLRVPWTTRRSN